ncbi:MAG: Fur family transcriptional regulator [Dichotomicrobium sp.]
MPAKAPALTKNQSIVLAALKDRDTPMTAYEILALDEVRDAGLKAPLTIYRALDKLIEAGLVHRLETINAFVACERCPHPGPAGFAICEKCRKTVELTLTDCETHLTENARRAGFRVDAMNVEMRGRCADCRSS